MSLPSIAHEDATLKVLSWGLLLGVRWYDIPRFASLQRYRELQTRHLHSLGSEKGLVVSFSDATGELHFDAGSRELVEAVMSDAKGRLLGMAQVITGDGFGAASLRSVLSGTQLAVRPDYPVRVFGDIRTAQPWLEELLVTADLLDLASNVGTVLLPSLEPGRRPA
jgi:hypothetical protein